MIKLQAVSTDGSERTEEVLHGGGRIVVAHFPRGISRGERIACAEQMRDALPPEDTLFVLPDGWHIEVLQPVDVQAEKAETAPASAA